MKTYERAARAYARAGGLFVLLAMAWTPIAKADVSLFQKTVMSGDTSAASTSLAALNGRLYIAWMGTDGAHHLNMMSSTDNGMTFGRKITFGDTSDAAPALAVHNGQLFIAWRGHGNTSLNVARVDLQGDGISGLSQKRTLSDTSPMTPALASLDGKLYLAWTGTDKDHHLNLMCSTDNGQSFGHKSTLGDTSDAGPAIAAHNGNLFIAWRGHGNTSLNVGLVARQGDAIGGLSRKVVLGDTSNDGPTLASLDGRLYLGWNGTDNAHRLNIMYSTDDGNTFRDKGTSAETSDDGPGLLAVATDGLFITWRGTGNQWLNVAKLNVPVSSGWMRPKYAILTVIYAPPGTNGGKSSSSVDYANGSSTGSTISTGSSFRVEAKVNESATFFGLSESMNFQFARTATDTHTVDSKKSQTFDIKLAGPATDGVDHDKDQIWLWLNPRVDVSVMANGTVLWSPAVDGNTMDIQYVTVGALKNPSTMPQGVAQRLAQFHITAQDYAEMLRADPFAAGATIDPARFVQTTMTFPYEPPPTANDPVPTVTLALRDELITTDTHKVDYEESVGLTVGGSPSFLGIISGKLEASTTMKWTQSSSTSASHGSSQTATVTIGGPAYGYTGRTDMAVYWDRLFRTFAFAPAPDPVIAEGALVNAQGKVLANTEVQLRVGDAVRRTVTDAKGRYRFHGRHAGTGTLTAPGISKTLEVRPLVPPPKVPIGVAPHVPVELTPASH